MITGDTELKSRLLAMMAWFHDFCRENGIRYYALGGTMLGAVRHQGFIPWDDDIDVGVPRSDYERLERLIAASEQRRYVFESPRSPAKEYLYAFSKLYDTETTLVENTRFQIRRGIYLDIFPLDGMGDTEEEARRRFGAIDRRFKLLLARTTGIRKGRNILKNASVMAARLIPDFLLENKEFVRRIDRLASGIDFDSCTYGGNPFGAWRGREIMPRRVMGTPTLYPFEDMEIYGAEDADAYLTHLYGNWKQLPPEEKRVSHHDYLLCDLEHSYLDK